MRNPFRKRQPSVPVEPDDPALAAQSLRPSRSLAEMMADGETLDDDARRLGEMVEKILEPALAQLTARDHGTAADQPPQRTMAVAVPPAIVAAPDDNPLALFEPEHPPAEDNLAREQVPLAPPLPDRASEPVGGIRVDPASPAQTSGTERDVARTAPARTTVNDPDLMEIAATQATVIGPDGAESAAAPMARVEPGLIAAASVEPDLVETASADPVRAHTPHVTPANVAAAVAQTASAPGATGSSFARAQAASSSVTTAGRYPDLQFGSGQFPGPASAPRPSGLLRAEPVLAPGANSEQGRRPAVSVVKLTPVTPVSATAANHERAPLSAVRAVERRAPSAVEARALRAVDGRGPSGVEGAAVSAVEKPAAPPRPRLSLDTVLARQTPLFWYEAVAIVERTCAALVQEDGRELPPPDLPGILIGADGTVEVHGTPRGESSVSRLGRILHVLAPAESTPPRLRLFITQWIASPQTQAIRDLATDLTYFARPNPEGLIRAVYERCMETPMHAAAPPVREPEETPAPEPVPAAALQKKRVLAALVAASVTASVAAAGILLGYVPPLWGSALPVAPAGVTDIALPGDTAAATPAAPAARRAAAGTASAAPAQQRQATFPAILAPTPADPPALSQPSPALAAAPRAAPAILETAPPLPIEVAAAPPAGIPPVYSVADLEVEPPRLLSAVMPELLIAGFDIRTNAVELLISETGDVERARMVGGPQRLPDIMLISRAKAWTFDPATRDGQPVRYRLVLTWNVSP